MSWLNFDGWGKIEFPISSKRISSSTFWHTSMTPPYFRTTITIVSWWSKLQTFLKFSKSTFIWIHAVSKPFSKPKCNFSEITFWSWFSTFQMMAWNFWNFLRIDFKEWIFQILRNLGWLPGSLIIFFILVDPGEFCWNIKELNLLRNLKLNYFKRVSCIAPNLFPFWWWWNLFQAVNMANVRQWLWCSS